MSRSVRALPAIELLVAPDDGRGPAEPVLVHCGHGERAMSAASLLERTGHRDVVVLAGSPTDRG